MRWLARCGEWLRGSWVEECSGVGWCWDLEVFVWEERLVVDRGGV